MEINSKKFVIVGIIGVGLIAVLLFVGGALGKRQVEGTASVADSLQGNTATAMQELQISDSVQGKGEGAKPGDTLTVHYVGTLTDGTKFDSSRDRNVPFQFVLGARRVIPCWEQGMLGMKAGGERKLTCPSSLAYGESGVGNIIPPGATLIFDVELLQITPGIPQQQ